MLREVRVRVEPCAHRGAALRQKIEPRQGRLNPLHRQRQLCGIAGKFLAQCNGGGVLHMGAADLDQTGEFFGLGVKARLELPQRRQEVLGQRGRRRHMHSGGKGIIGGLAEVDVIIGMNRRHPATRRSKTFIGAIGDHLDNVHVRLGAGAGLPDLERKMIVKPARDDLVGRRHDRVRQGAVEDARRSIDLGRDFFNPRQRVNDFAWHELGADREVLQCSLGLAPHSQALATSIGPIVSFSVRNGLIFAPV